MHEVAGLEDFELISFLVIQATNDVMGWVDMSTVGTYHVPYLLKGSTMQQTAKIFATGRSQAVRLPLEFRFDVSEVFIRHDPVTGDVVLSRKPTDWQGLLEVVAQNKDEELLIERRPAAPHHVRRDPFEGWKE